MKNPAKIALFAVVAFAAFMALGGPQPTASDAAPLLHQLEQKMSALRSVSMEFTQERRLKLFSEPLKSEGVLLIDRPDLIRWETTAPYQSILLGDHRSVAQFEFDDGKWTKLHLGFPQLLKKLMDQMVLMHEGKLEVLTNDFTITAPPGTTAELLLVPKDETVHSMLASMEFRLLPDLSAPQEVVLNEPNGDSTHILFHNEHRDMTFPAGTFDQSKPLDLAAIRAVIGNAP
jgi:outer membrane lipoprotein carrier protein